MITFNKVVFVDDNDSVPVDATNLNNIETALKTVCDGGSGSGLDADTVRGKSVATRVPLTKGLVGHWDLSSSEFPDKASSFTYFRREWTSIDAWTSTDTSTIVGFGNNHLTLTPNSSSELVFERNISGMPSKTLKIKIKNTGNFNPANGVLYLSGGSGYQALSLVPYYDYYIGTIQTDATVGSQLKLKLILDTAASSAVQHIQWIYVGSGEYLSDTLDTFNYLPGALYGPTPTRTSEQARSLFFDGVNDRAVLTIPNLTLATSFSLVLRASSQSTAGTRTLAVLGQGSSAGGVTISSGSGSNSFNIEFHRSGANEVLSSVFSLDAVNISTIVLTYVASTKAWTLYKDGVKVTDGTLANTPVLPAGTWELGSRNSTEYFKGIISSATLYDKALSLDEVWEMQQRPYFLDYNSYSPPVIKANPPLTISSEGRPGQIVYDSGYVYVCVAPNSWKRAALTSW